MTVISRAAAHSILAVASPLHHDAKAASPSDQCALCGMEPEALLAAARARRCAALGPAFLVLPLTMLLILFTVLFS